MASSEQLRKNKKQHKPKNRYSKEDDKRIAQAMQRVIRYVDDRFDLDHLGYSIEYVRSMKLAEMMDLIREHEQRLEFAMLTNQGAFIRPDGGILLLTSKEEPDFRRVVLVAEMKRQGTNDKRIREGKKRQARGNAIERLGKNLIGIRATLQYERVTPFVSFGWGVDFAPDSSILDRVVTMNEFYPLNRIYVFKKDGYAPVSMFFRREQWEVEELYEVMREIAETSIRYYLF